MGRDERIYEEAADLWRELFGEPPPITADGGMMLDVIMRSLPEMDYRRLQSPHLRADAVVMPRHASH